MGEDLLEVQRLVRALDEFGMVVVAAQLGAQVLSSHRAQLTACVCRRIGGVLLRERGEIFTAMEGSNNLAGFVG